MKNIILFLLLITSLLGSSQEKLSNNVKYEFIRDSIYSTSTKEHRKSLASESRKKIKSSEYRIFGLNKKRKYGTLQA